MRIEYKRSFSHFVDNYLVSYYTRVGRTLWRLSGGVIMIIFGAFMLIFASFERTETWTKFFLNPIGVLVILYGIYDLLRPLINIGLVWLRREEFLGEDGAHITLELHTEGIRLIEGDGHVDIPFDQIDSIQRRANSAWIVAKPDNLIYVPGEDLISGDHDAFIEAVEERLAELTEDQE